MPVFLLLIAVPLVEMFLLFAVSDAIGAVATFALVIVSAMIGLRVLRYQGVATLSRVNMRLRSGESPAPDMLSGVILAMAGVLLLIPGVITDALGLLFLLPFFRHWLVRRMIRAGGIGLGGRAGGFQFYQFRQGQRGAQQEQDSDVFEGEFTREQAPERRIRRPDDE